MSVPIRWPLYVTAWAVIASVFAAIDDNWVILVCATVTIVSVWGMWHRGGAA